MKKLLYQIFAVFMAKIALAMISTTERAYWVKPFTDDPEVLAHNATLRKELAQKIVPLGKKVQSILAELPFGEGDNFLKLLDEYNDLNKQFIRLVTDDKANSKPEVDYVFDRLYPHILDTDFCEEDMKRNFSWTNHDVQVFYEKREIANDNYIDINLYHHCHQQPIIGYIFSTYILCSPRVSLRFQLGGWAAYGPIAMKDFDLLKPIKKQFGQ